jgi:hypothetical protein
MWVRKTDEVILAKLRQLSESRLLQLQDYLSRFSVAKRRV